MGTRQPGCHTIPSRQADILAAMQIPHYWAQTRLRHETGMRHGVTVQRWGWSDESQQAAEAHARERAQAALDQALAAPKLRNLDGHFRRMERLNEYGLNGETPIREEILEQRGETVMTRNSYGAHCLNTPHVAIADVDYPREAPPPSLRPLGTLAVVALGWWFLMQSQGWSAVAWASLALAALVLVLWFRRWLAARQDAAKRADPREAAIQRITHFSEKHPDWGLRIYSTPKGLRVIVTHKPMQPADADVQALFSALQVDPLYQRLCTQQQCFRARVSGKPWRMDMGGPSPQVRRWPADDKHRADRERWSREYDNKAAQYSACQFVSQLGEARIALDAQPLVDWHDEASRAHNTALPVA